MGQRKKMLAGGQKYKPNLFIGGVGSTINTPELLSIELNGQATVVPVSWIKNFEVVGNDIQCHITNQYTIGKTAFLNDTNITYYIDTENAIALQQQNTTGSAFHQATNLKIFSAINYNKLYLYQIRPDMLLGIVHQ